jgi:guanylate kinase
MSAKPNTIVIIAGPSLTGKSNLSSLLLDQGFAALVSTTTRGPREGEINGKHYHFLSKEEFKAKLARKGFVEHVEVDSRLSEEAGGKRVKVEGNFYGVGREEVIKAFAAGKPVVSVCEPSGVKAIYAYAMEQGWNPLRVFLNNKPELLVERFLERFKEDSKADPAAYATRLLKMTKFEQEQWVAPAMSGADPYELVFPDFVADTQVSVLRDVLEQVGLPYKPRRGLSA